jgi:hypoxanthine phosphoribosyltransferase
MNPPATPNVEKILFTEEQIAARIGELAAKISRDYQGKTIKLIGVLKGSIFFLTELARRIDVPVKIDFLGISSFSNKSGAPGVRYLLQTLAGRAPNSLAVCAFLDRNSRRIVQVRLDYTCFEIPDRFVVGFGLDHNQLYRNLGYVAVLKP